MTNYNYDNVDYSDFDNQLYGLTVYFRESYTPMAYFRITTPTMYGIETVGLYNPIKIWLKSLSQ